MFTVDWLSGSNNTQLFSLRYRMFRQVMYSHKLAHVIS